MMTIRGEKSKGRSGGIIFLIGAQVTSAAFRIALAQAWLLI
jgi:hypothetical protein